MFNNHGDRSVLDVYAEAWAASTPVSERATRAVQERIVLPGQERAFLVGCETVEPSFSLRAWRIRWTDADGRQWSVDQPQQPEPLPLQGSAAAPVLTRGVEGSDIQAISANCPVSSLGGTNLRRMDPLVTAAIVGVSGTVIVGVAGFGASIWNTRKTIGHPRESRIWDERAAVYVQALAAVHYRQMAREHQTRTDPVDDQARSRAQAILATYARLPRARGPPAGVCLRASRHRRATQLDTPRCHRRPPTSSPRILAPDAMSDVGRSVLNSPRTTAAAGWRCRHSPRA